MRKICFDAKREAWVEHELKRLSEKLGIPVTDDASLKMLNINWSNQERARGLLKRKNKPESLRLRARQKGDDHSGLMRQLLDTRAVVLVLNDSHLLSPKEDAPKVEAKADETPDEAMERACKAEAARQEREAEERRAERAAMRRAAEDMAWMVFNLADLLAVQIKIEPLDLLIDMVETHNMHTHSPATPWPQYHDKYAAIDLAYGEAADDHRLLLGRKLMVARELGSRMSGYSPKDQFDFDSAMEDVRDLANEWGLKLPKGWDTPPVHHTSTNCHVCGRFTSMDRITKRDEEEGWQVQGDVVMCSDECRAQTTETKSQPVKKSQKGKGKRK